jgi:hypothetical protein
VARLPSRIGPRSLAKLTHRQRTTHERALSAVRLMRDDGLSLTRAASAEGIAPATVRRYVPTSLEKPHGRWLARRGYRDRTPREMETISAGQRVALTTTSLAQASLLARYKQAVEAYLGGADPSVLSPFEGVTVGGYELETDLDELDRIAGLGQLADWRLYANRSSDW